MATQQDNRVIVVGAGPVGAVMTLALVKKGIPVTLLEALPDAAEDQRAATVHPPTVEMLVELGLKDEAFSDEPSGGMSAPLFHFRDRVTGELVAVFDISLLKGEIPYPFVLQWEQYKLVHAALPHIRASGIGEVRFSTKVTGLAQHAPTTSTSPPPTKSAKRDHPRPLRHRHRRRQQHRAQGRRHRVRGLHLPERFIKIGTSFDFGATGKGFCTRNYFFDPNEWLNLFKVKGYGPPGIWRGVSRCRPARPTRRR